MHYVHFYLVSCFLNQHSYFIAHTSLCIILHKKYAKQKYEKLRNGLFEMKEGLFASIKGQFCLTKEHFDIIQKGRWRLNLSLLDVFLIALVQI